MRTSTFAALGLALCGDVLGSRHAREFSTRKTSKTISLDIFQDPGNFMYLANISIGTPPQTVTVQIDTGSSDLWVFSNDVQLVDGADGECVGPYFNTGHSSSFQRFGDGVFNISYADESGVTGDYMLETVQFGGMTLHNVTMGLATTANPNGESLYGIMGIDFPDIEASVTFGSELYNLPYQMVSQGLINEPVYSLYLNDINAPSGTLLFGGIDTDKFDGPLVILDLIPKRNSEGGNVFDFNVELTAVGGVQSGKPFASFNFADSQRGVLALLDSGTTTLELPKSTVEDIATQLELKIDEDEQYYVPCALVEYNITLEFQFGGSSGPLLGMPLSEVISPNPFTQVDGEAMCYVWIEGSEDFYVLGAPFLRSAYAVFDPANNQVALAQAISNVTSSHIDALSAVASVPSSIGTLPASFVGPGYGYGTGGIPGSTLVDDLARPTATATTTEALRRTDTLITTTSAGIPTSISLHGGSSIPGIVALGLAGHEAAQKNAAAQTNTASQTNTAAQATTASQTNTAATTATGVPSTGPVAVSTTTPDAGAASLGGSDRSLMSTFLLDPSCWLWLACLK